ncbi:MAG: Rrf2 family transcriptional regulator [Acidiferrobacter sp.]
MQLTRYSDYALRILMYLSMKEGEGAATISEIASFYGISRNHLVKIVHRLGQLGFITTTRGKGGGLKLARAAAQIGIGEVVRQTEANFDIVECFNVQTNACRLTPICHLKGMLMAAQTQFLGELDTYTLADAIAGRHRGFMSLLERIRLGVPAP